MRDTTPVSEPPAPRSDLAAAAVRNGVDYADVEAYARGREHDREMTVIDAVIACDSVFVARLFWHGEFS